MTDEERNEIELAGDVAEEAGIVDVAAGLEAVTDAGALEEISREELAEASNEITHGLDELEAAERASLMSEAVAEAGVVDVMEGAEMMSAAEEIEDLSMMLALMNEEDLLWSMDLAGISGQLQVAGDVVADLDMPVLADFLRDRGDVLRQMAAESIFQYTATRGIASALAEAGEGVEELGANEIAEGLTRLAVAEGLAEGSEELIDEGLADVAAGMEELDESQLLDEVAGDVAAEGIGEVAQGSAELGAAEMLHAAADEDSED